jgi:predicted PurR-regulated permease PerM
MTVMTTPEPVGASSVRQAPDAVADPRSKAGSPSGESPSTSRAEPPSESFAVLIPEIRLLVGLTTAAVIIAALYFGREILIPLALALLLGFVLHPLVAWIKRLGLPLLAAVTVVVTLSLGGVVLAGVALGHQVSSLSQQLPTYQSNIRKKLRDLRAAALGPGMFDGAVETLNVVKQEVEQSAAEDPPEAGAKRRAQAPAVQRVRIDAKPPTPFENALAWIEAAIGPLATASIVLVFLFLVLLDRDDLRDRLLRLLGGSLHRSTDAMDEAGRRISKYLTMQLVVV